MFNVLVAKCMLIRMPCSQTKPLDKKAVHPAAESSTGCDMYNRNIIIIIIPQVSQLVILHEEAENGRIVPDLGPPVMAVGAAVTNLVMVTSL